MEQKWVMHMHNPLVFPCHVSNENNEKISQILILRAGRQD